MSAPPYGRWVPGNDWSGLDGQVPEPLRRVSVIVLHYEQPRELARTLTALARQSYPAERVEIIVSDDGSARAPTLAPGVALVRGTRPGAHRSEARNRGVAASHGELLVFLDADTAPEPEFLARLTRLPALVPEAVTVGRRRHADLAATPPDGPVATLGPAHELAAPAWLADAYAASENLRLADPRAFRFMISAVLCTSRWFFDEVGGFDESFDAYGGEDWEWAHRAWLAGAVFAHEPTALAWHDGPEWSARSAADHVRARREKNAEAIRLSGLIPVRGQRPHGLRTRRPLARITIAPEIDADGAFITVDGLLGALPHAEVLVTRAVLARCHGDPRVRALETPGPEPAALELEVHAGVRVEPAAFAALCEALMAEDVGRCRLSDAEGMLIEIRSRRDRLRRERWGPQAALREQELADAMVRRLGVAPDVEAYLGGFRRS